MGLEGSSNRLNQERRLAAQKENDASRADLSTYNLNSLLRCRRLVETRVLELIEEHARLPILPI